MNGIRPTVGIEFDDKYTNAKNKLLDFIKALDESFTDQIFFSGRCSWFRHKYIPF